MNIAFNLCKDETGGQCPVPVFGNLFFRFAKLPTQHCSPYALDLPTRSQSSQCCSPYELDLSTRSQSSRRCNPHGLDLPTRPWSSRHCSPHGLHIPRGSIPLRARSPHGAAVLMGSTSLGARPPYPLAVLTALQSSWVRTLYLTTTRTIDPPSPRFLAIHQAITLVLHQSAAGDYINRILEHLDQINVREDGSTEVGHLIELRLGGWLRSIRAC
jgi:hypothetical protein